MLRSSHLEVERKLPIFWQCLNWQTDFIELNHLIYSVRVKFLNYLRQITSSKEYPFLAELKKELNMLVERDIFKADEVECVLEDIKNLGVQLKEIFQSNYQNKVVNFVSEMNKYLVSFEKKQTLPEKLKSGYHHAGAKNRSLEKELSYKFTAKLTSEAKKQNAEDIKKKKLYNPIERRIMPNPDMDDQLYKRLLDSYYQFFKLCVIRHDYERLKICVQKGLEVSHKIINKDREDLLIIKKMEKISEDKFELLANFIKSFPVEKWIIIKDYINRLIRNSPEKLGKLLNHLPLNTWSCLSKSCLDIKKIVKNQDDFNALRLSVHKSFWGSLKALFDNIDYLPKETVRWMDGFQLCARISKKMDEIKFSSISESDEFFQNFVASLKTTSIIPENVKYSRIIMDLNKLVINDQTKNDSSLLKVAIQYIKHQLHNSLDKDLTTKLKESIGKNFRLFSSVPSSTVEKKDSENLIVPTVH